MAEGGADGESAGVRHPVPLCYERAASNTVSDILQSRIQIKHFRRCSLGKFAALEERRNPHKPSVVIPHHSIILVVIRHPKNVLKNFKTLAASLLQECLFLAVVGNVPRILRHLSQGIDVELQHRGRCELIQILIGRVVDVPLYFALDENGTIFGHFRFLHHKTGVGGVRDRMTMSDWVGGMSVCRDVSVCLLYRRGMYEAVKIRSSVSYGRRRCRSRR